MTVCDDSLYHFVCKTTPAYAWRVSTAFYQLYIIVSRIALNCKPWWKKPCPTFSTHTIWAYYSGSLPLAVIFHAKILFLLSVDTYYSQNIKLLKNTFERFNIEKSNLPMILTFCYIQMSDSQNQFMPTIFMVLETYWQRLLLWFHIIFTEWLTIGKLIFSPILHQNCVLYSLKH